jgi:hypothetical protein
LNFPPQFWGVDTGDHRMASASTRPEEIKYSSIMDYHQRFNSDFGGIGLYDKAAIKFGYTEMVEAWDERLGSILPGGWEQNAGIFDYTDLPYLYSGANTEGVISDHVDDVEDRYFAGDETAAVDLKDPSLGISPRPENLYKRRDITFKDLKRHTVRQWLGNFDNAPEVLTEVPYMYCSDAFAWGGNLTCNRWDKGANSQEIVANAGEMYDAYYVFNNFRREKLDMNPGSYMGRLYSRTYQPMLNAFRYFFYYRRSSLRMWPFVQDWAGAAHQGLNFFGRVLQTVEPGRYCLNGEDFYHSKEMPGAGCDTSFVVNRGEGRDYTSTFTDEFFFKMDSVGHTWDKVLAMQALADSSAFFTRDFSSSFNRGAFSIGFYRVFAPELIQLFTDLMTGNSLGFSPVVNLNGSAPQLVYRDIVPVGEAATINGPLVKASSSFALQRYAMVFPMAFYTSSVDRQLDYSKRARITIVGSAQDPTVDPSVEDIIWEDPLSHIEYRSRLTETEAMSPGYLLLQDAQAFTNDGTDGEPEGPWHVAKREHDEAEAALAADPSNTSLQNALDAKALQLAKMNAQLADKVQIVDGMRTLSDILEYSN